MLFAAFHDPTEQFDVVDMGKELFFRRINAYFSQDAELTVDDGFGNSIGVLQCHLDGPAGKGRDVELEEFPRRVLLYPEPERFLFFK